MGVELTVTVTSGQADSPALPPGLADRTLPAGTPLLPGLVLDSWDRLGDQLHSIPPQARRIIVDAVAFGKSMPRWIVALSAVLADWEGSELNVILPPGEDPRRLLRPLADLLRALEKRARGIRIVSCPTCARCHTDLLPFAKRIAEKLEAVTVPLDVAIMGCEVNGPGEARAADVGVAFGKGVALIFRHGRVVKRVKETEAETCLLAEIRRLARQAGALRGRCGGRPVLGQ